MIVDSGLWPVGLVSEILNWISKRPVNVKLIELVDRHGMGLEPAARSALV
jgi:hypothetical protein